MGDKGVARATLRSVVLRGLSRVSMLTGLALIAWPVYVTTDSAIAQWSGRRQLARAEQGAHTVPSNATLVDQRETIVVRTPGTTATPAAPPGSVLGQFEVPRLGLSYVLLEGTDNKTLGRSVGHVEGTGLPGSAGNISIAGHRDTHFRKLEWIHRDDEIVVTSREGTRDVYRVEWSRLFAPGDIQVLDEEHGPAVTLITCFPFEYVGSAPLRLVVRALPVDATKTRLIASAQRQ
jgi:LPXTG-site transpeptidase (sortase) family protein